MVGILFGLLAGVGCALLLANVSLALLQLSHRDDLARRLAKWLLPYASFLRLGGSSKADHERSKHA